MQKGIGDHHGAKRIVGNKQYGGVRQYIPLKMNAANVMPIIFAQALMFIPALFSGTAFAAAFSSMTGFWYNFTLAVLVIAFTYFYTSISFQPDEMAKNIQQQGGVIPHVRPGKPTADFLARTNNRLTLFAALFLAVLATLPNLFTVGLQTSVPFAASSLLIAVSVVLETKRQLDDLLVSRNYDTLT